MKRPKKLLQYLETITLKVALLLLVAALFWATGGLLMFKAFGAFKLVGLAMFLGGIVFSRRLIISNNKIK